MFREGSVEGPLMMVISVFQVIILPTNVDNGVACLQHGWISSTNKGGRGVVWQKAKHVNGQGFVCMEMAIVGANEDRVSLDSLGRYFRRHFDCSAKHAQVGRIRGMERLSNSGEGVDIKTL